MPFVSFYDGFTGRLCDVKLYALTSRQIENEPPMLILTFGAVCKVVIFAKLYNIVAYHRMTREGSLLNLRSEENVTVYYVTREGLMNTLYKWEIMRDDVVPIDEKLLLEEVAPVENFVPPVEEDGSPCDELTVTLAYADAVLDKHKELLDKVIEEERRARKQVDELENLKKRWTDELRFVFEQYGMRREGAQMVNSISKKACELIEGMIVIREKRKGLAEEIEKISLAEFKRIEERENEASILSDLLETIKDENKKRVIRPNIQ